MKMPQLRWFWILAVLLLLAAGRLMGAGKGVDDPLAAEMRTPRWRQQERVGMRSGRKLLQSGRLAFETFGLPPASHAEEREVFARYGVECRSVAGCTPTTSQLAHAKGFNAVMMPAILRRHGKGFFQRVRVESVLLWRARNPGKQDGVDLQELSSER